MSLAVDIGLLWHSDSNGNLGVGALTVGNMALAREAAARAGVEPRFHLFHTDAAKPYVEGFAARHFINGRYMASPTGYWRDIAGMDLVLDIGGGDSFTDIYPDRRFAYLTATKAMALARGVPLVLSPQTIGPFSRQPHSAIAAALLRRAAAVFCRDPLSMAATRKLAPSLVPVQTVDVAFALPFERAARTSRPRVGINVSALLYGDGGANFGFDFDYRDLTHRLVEGLLERGDTDVVLVSHVLTPDHPHEDDPTAAALLQRRYPALSAAPRFASPSDAKSFISGLDFLIGARMHATIAAYSSGVPVVPVSYSRKFEGLFGGLDYPHVLAAKGRTAKEAAAFVLDRFDRRAELAADIARGAPVIERGLEAYVSTLAGLLARLAASRPANGGAGR